MQRLTAAAAIPTPIFTPLEMCEGVRVGCGRLVADGVDSEGAWLFDAVVPALSRVDSVDVVSGSSNCDLHGMVKADRMLKNFRTYVYMA